MNLFTKKTSALKIFEGIDENVVSEILENAQKEVFPEGVTIIEEWSHPDGKWYIIESWAVSVSVGWQKIARLHTGNMFGEIALLNEEPRTATIIAEEEVEAIVLSQETLFDMIENDDNSINKEIMRRMEENLEKE